MQWSAFLLIPVGALCVANGVRGLAAVVEPGRERRVLVAAGTTAALLALLVVANVQLRQPLNDARGNHNGLPRLGLPGAGDIRLPAEEAETYQAVATTIDDNCASLVTLPGLNSFYFWTEIEPPTLYNATAWPTLFDDADEERVIGEIDSIEGLCLLRNTGQAEAWGPVEGPLVDYLSEGFDPIATIGPYEILKRPARTGSSA